MRKKHFLILTTTLFSLILVSVSAWANRGHIHHRSHFHHHHPDRFSFGFALAPAYGSRVFGYYGNHRSGFYGNYAFGSPYYYRPYYGGYAMPPYYPPVVVVPATPPVYIERPSSLQSSPPQNNYWHYCENPAGYYPYVKKCPDGWLKVAPQPTE